MTIEVSQTKPSLINGLESDFGTTVAASIWRKMINNHTWVEKSVPIGFIMFFYESITEADGTPKDPPNPEIWQFCDGNPITDTDSPLFGQNTPNMLDRFPKGSSTEQLTGGQYTINIQHDHGGQTGTTDDREDVIADVGADHSIGSPHYHSINNVWSSAEPIIPKYTALQFYMRIK